MCFTYTDITQYFTTEKDVIISIIKINKLYHLQIAITNDNNLERIKKIITDLKIIYGGDIEYKGFIEFGFHKYSKAYLLNIERIDEEVLGVDLINHYLIGSDKIKTGES